MKDSKFVVTVLSLLLPLVSILPMLSVHGYCENRGYAAGLCGLAIVIFIFFCWPQRGTTEIGKQASYFGMVLCGIAILMNGAFIVWATNECSPGAPWAVLEMFFF